MPEGHLPEHFRLFIAITVPDVVKVEIKRTQDQLRASVSQGAVGWTKPENFHLTLRFLGKVETVSIVAIVDALRAVCEPDAPLQLRVSGVGFFPKARAPRVIWVGVKDSADRLARIQQAVQAASLRFTTEKPEERFNAHITLGRIKQLARHETGTLVRTAEQLSGSSLGQWTAQ